MKVFAGIIWIFVFIAEAMGQPAPIEPAAAEVRLAWIRNFNAGNTDAVLALYTEDAVLVSEAGTFKGREAMRNWVQASIDQGSKLESIEATAEKSSGALAYSTGRSRRIVGSEVHLGQYLIVMEKVGGDWKIKHHFSANMK